MSDAIAIIPARGGSKRLARKNVRPLGGKPVLAYTVEAARGSRLCRRVIVSTEDDEIAEAARAAGAEVFDRSEWLASDRARIVDVVRDVLDRVEIEEGTAPERFCTLLPTAALRTAEDVVAVHDLLEPGHCDFAMAITDFSENPFQAMVADEQGYLKLMWAELANTPRWDAPVVHVDNGSVYWCDTSAFRDFGDYYGPNLRGHVMPRERSVDVNTQQDWELLEFFFARRKS